LSVQREYHGDGLVEKDLSRRNPQGGTIEEEIRRRVMREESSRRKHRGAIVEEASWRRIVQENH